MGESGEILDKAKEICRETDWASAALKHDLSALDELVSQCEAAMSLVDSMAAQPPPLALLSVHRQATRAVKSMADAIVRLTLLHIERYHERAMAEMTLVQAALDLAAERAHHVSTLTERASRVLLAPGFWTLGDEYETGRIAWEGVDNQVSTVTQAAHIVRETFCEVPGIAELPDEQAFALMPAAAIGASFQDPERLIERAKEVRRILDQADGANTGWVADPSYFAERVWVGHRRLIDQVVRLGHELRTDSPRKFLMETALDVYSKFIEGPLRMLGGVVAVAGDSVTGVVFDRATSDTYGPRKVANVLQQQAASVVHGIDDLLRHAEAHYDYSITATGVTLSHLPPRGQQTGRLTDEFTDEDFFEQLLNLNEALVAIELAVIPYAMTHPESVVQSVLEARGATAEVGFETLRALGGLKGWTDVEFVIHAPVLRVTGTYRGPASADPVEEFLPVVAAAWTLFEDVFEIRVGVPDSAHPAVLERRQFPLPGDVDGVRLHRVASLIAATRAQTSGGDAQRWMITELLLPAAVVPVHLVTEVLRGEGSLDDAQQYLRWVLPLLEGAVFDEPADSLRWDLIQEHKALSRVLGPASVALAKEDRRFIARCERDLRKCVDRLTTLREQAISVSNSIAPR